MKLIHALGYGAALLRDGDHLVEMCKEIGTREELGDQFLMNTFAVQKIPYPLSVKCRLHESIDVTIALLKRLNAVGVNTFTLHVRAAARLLLLLLICVRVAIIGNAARSEASQIGRQYGTLSPFAHSHPNNGLLPLPVN